MQVGHDSDGHNEPAHTHSRPPPPRTNEPGPGQALPEALPAEAGKPRSQHAQHAQHTGEDRTARESSASRPGVYPAGARHTQAGARASSVQLKPAHADRAVPHADREVSPEAAGTLEPSSSPATLELDMWSGPVSRDLGALSVSSSSSGQPASGHMSVFVPLPEVKSRSSRSDSFLPVAKSSSERSSDMPGSSASADMATAHMHAHASTARRPRSAPASQPSGGSGRMHAGARDQSMPPILEGDASSPAEIESAQSVPSTEDLQLSHVQLSPRLQLSVDSMAALGGRTTAGWPTHHTNEGSSPFIGSAARAGDSPTSSATSEDPPTPQVMRRRNGSDGLDLSKRAADSPRSGLQRRNRDAPAGTDAESSQPPAKTATELPGARDLTVLEQKRIDSMTAEYTSVIASYEAARQAAHNRNAIFSGLMSAALAVSTDRQDADVRSFLGMCGIATCMYWFISLHRDHFMAVKRLNHGRNVENSLAIVFESCRIDALQAPPKYFEMLKEGNWYKAVAEDCQRCCCCRGRSQCRGCTCGRRCPACCGCPWFMGHVDAGGTACMCMCCQCKCHEVTGCCRMWCFPAVRWMVVLIDVHFHFCLLTVFAVAWLYVLVSQPSSSQGAMDIVLPATPVVHVAPGG